MTLFVPFMMFGWIPFTIFLFSKLGSRRAAVASLILGWLFLPGATLDFPSFPDYTKIPAVCFPIILSTMLFDFERFRKLRPNKLDIPIIVFCICAFASSLSNGLGVYDAISGFIKQIFNWGFPYAIGKMYFSDDQGLREFAIWTVIGGLIYVPFCIWEMRMSPNLHYNIYGFRHDRFVETIRLGGYRPVVFFRHGIALGFWMMSTVLMAIVLWRSKCVKRISGISMKLNVIVLFTTFILCRSLGAIMLFFLGIVIFYGIRSRRRKIIFLIMALIPVLYASGRQIGQISSESLVTYATIISDDRARSLFGRLYHEELLMEKANDRPFFGWGGYGRNRIYNEDGEDLSVTDGYWIIVFGTYGMVGLISLGLVLLMPVFLFWKRYRHLNWEKPIFAPVVGFSTILILYTIDSLMNAMINPIFTVVSGGILGWISSSRNAPNQFLEKNETTIP